MSKLRHKKIVPCYYNTIEDNSYNNSYIDYAIADLLSTAHPQLTQKIAEQTTIIQHLGKYLEMYSTLTPQVKMEAAKRLRASVRNQMMSIPEVKEYVEKGLAFNDSHSPSVAKEYE